MQPCSSEYQIFQMWTSKLKPQSLPKMDGVLFDQFALLLRYDNICIYMVMWRMINVRCSNCLSSSSHRVNLANTTYTACYFSLGETALLAQKWGWCSPMLFWLIALLFVLNFLGSHLRTQCKTGISRKDVVFRAATKYLALLWKTQISKQKVAQCMYFIGQAMIFFIK